MNSFTQQKLLKELRSSVYGEDQTDAYWLRVIEVLTSEIDAACLDAYANGVMATAKAVGVTHGYAEGLIKSTQTAPLWVLQMRR